MRLDIQSRRAKQREARIRASVEREKTAGRTFSEPRTSYYADAEECGHLAHVTEIVNGRCKRCQGLTIRDGNGNLVA